MRNVGKLTLGRSVQAISSLAYLAFATRSLGPEGFGKLILIHSLCLAVAQLARFESWQTMVRFGMRALRAEAPAHLRRIVNFGLVLDFSGMVLGMLVYALLLYPVGAWLGLSVSLRHLALIYGLLTIAVLNGSGTATGLLHLLDRFGRLAMMATLEPIIRLIGAAAIFTFGGGIEGFLLVWLLALSASHLGVIFSAFPILAHRGPDWRFRFEPGTWVRPEPGMWRYALGTHWVGAMNVAQDYLPTLAAGGVIGATGAGLLKVAKQFADVLTGAATKLLVPALFPELARLKEHARKALVTRLNLLVVGLFSLVFVFLAIFGKDLIRLIAGPEFSMAYPTMLWLAFAGLVGATSFSFETLLTATGAIRRVVFANTVSLVVYFIVLALLLKPQGINGVGMAAVAHATVRSTLLWWNARSAKELEQ